MEASRDSSSLWKLDDTREITKSKAQQHSGSV
jgi:hypothetical protein